MNFFKCVKNNYDHLVDTCTEKGQRNTVRIGSIGEHIIISGDSLDPNRKSSDCILFAKVGNCILAVVLELRTRVRDVGDIIKKLQNTAALVLEIIKKCNTDGLRVEFYPILYHCEIHHYQKRALLKKCNRIRFGRGQSSVIMKEYKIPLLNIIEKFKATRP
jgi:hypothetical protein